MELRNLMFDDRVACKALHFVLGYMIPVQEFRCILCLQYLSFIMTLKTDVLAYVSVTCYNVDVTLLASDSSIHIHLMVEDKSGADLDISLCLKVA